MLPIARGARRRETDRAVRRTQVDPRAIADDLRIECGLAMGEGERETELADIDIDCRRDVRE